nr:acyl-CoA dehydrogenase [Streptomyces sp. NBC_00899]WSX81424.1 acyl-CoA dehydrogenase [Streptomyces sp. NBC_00899]
MSDTGGLAAPPAVTYPTAYAPPAAPLAGTDLDPPLRALDRHCRELSEGMREAGATVDRDPDAIAGLLHLPAVGFQAQGSLPPEYRDTGAHPAGPVQASASSLGWAVTAERLAYGDAGVLLACPGPSLSGLAVEALADDAQRTAYYERVTSAPTWTFFGLTEPRKGSAAMELETSLAPDDDGTLVLNGEKRYVGTAARAQTGVVFCRRAPGPWGIEAVLLDTAQQGFEAELLPMVGLRGARISHIRLTDLRVRPEQVLGRHRPPSRRGLYGALHVLYRGRPGIAGMALGVTQAVCDYTAAHRPAMPASARGRLDGVLDRAAALRRLVHTVAGEIDHGVVDVPRIGAVKSRAAALAEETTLLAAELLGPASLIEHPWLEKAYRDVRAFEYMEGTGAVHRLSVFHGLVKGDLLGSGPVPEPYVTPAGVSARAGGRSAG